jgi:hypothetical protein
MINGAHANGAACSISSCFQTLKGSKITDAVLVTSFVALLIIGVLASTGIFQFMGTANAAYLSYGMYAGAALFIIAEVIKVFVNYSKKKPELIQNAIDKTNDSGLPQPIAFEKLEKTNANKSVDEQIKDLEIDNSCTTSYNCKHKCQIRFADGSFLETELDKQSISTFIASINRDKIKVRKTIPYNFYDYNGIAYHFQFQSSKLTAEEILNRIRAEKK